MWAHLEKLVQSRGGLDALAGGLNDGDGRKLEPIQLTDALQTMVESGLVLKSFTLDEWYDAGRPNMLLDVNEVLLNQLGSSVQCATENTAVIEPCSIEKGCQIVNSVIGPNVSIAEGSIIENCILSRTIVGAGSRLENVNLTDTIVGDGVRLKGSPRKMNVGDHTDIVL